MEIKSDSLVDYSPINLDIRSIIIGSIIKKLNIYSNEIQIYFDGSIIRFASDDASIIVSAYNDYITITDDQPYLDTIVKDVIIDDLSIHFKLEGNLNVVIRCRSKIISKIYTVYDYLKNHKPTLEYTLNEIGFIVDPKMRINNRSHYSVKIFDARVNMGDAYYIFFLSDSYFVIRDYNDRYYLCDQITELIDCLNYIRDGNI